MECASKTKIECERSSTIGGNRGVVDGLEAEVMTVCSVRVRGRNDTNICSSINEKAQTRRLVSNKEEATKRMADNTRRR